MTTGGMMCVLMLWLVCWLVCNVVVCWLVVLMTDMYIV